MEGYLERVIELSGERLLMPGVYLWDYGAEKPMDISLFERQLDCCFELLKKGKTDGIVFCSNTIGDAKLQTNALLKKYIKEQGDIEI